MNKTQAKIIADSINECAHRLTTMVVTLPKIILDEFTMHKIFSINASLIDISFKEKIEELKKNFFVPNAFQQNENHLSNNYNEDVYYSYWVDAKDKAIELTTFLHDKGLSHEIFSRLLDPFMWSTILVTATEWEDFFDLICPRYEYKKEYFKSKKDLLRYIIYSNSENLDFYNSIDWFKINKNKSDFHMMALAEAMWDAYSESSPEKLEPCDWHIPFSQDLDSLEYIKYATKHFDKYPHELLSDSYALELALKIASARCAKISYEDNPKADYDADLRLYNHLLKNKHLYLFEHCARVMSEEEYDNYNGWCNNFKGFIQYKKILER